jgi:anaerobic ribonucleoside-triphosphate reductase activating protein
MAHGWREKGTFCSEIINKLLRRSPMKIRVAGIEKESVVDGPGLRFVIFVQGCGRRCIGCHNPGTWDIDGGQEMDTGEILGQIGETGLIRGVTFSGGEPFEQAAACALLAGQVKNLGKDIVTYTGYTFEELQARSSADEDARRLLEVSDILVDGPFMAEERDWDLPFRGSRNQRLILVQESLAAGRVTQAGA